MSLYTDLWARVAQRFSKLSTTDHKPYLFKDQAFAELIAGTNITITPGTNDVTISAAGATAGAWQTAVTQSGTYYTAGIALGDPEIPQYRLEGSIVRLRGGFTTASMISGTGAQQNITQLLSGYRPAKDANVVVALGNGTFQWLKINTAGMISIATGGVIASGMKIYLDNIQFSTT